MISAMDFKRYCGAIFMLIVVFRARWTHADNVRLVGGATHTEGRVEVYHDNEWGTVCNDDFNSHAASVVCSMLGLPSSGAYATGVYGRGNGTIWLDDVKCNGNENSLRSCTTRGWGEHNCGHREDVGVVCTEAENVRLVGGATHAEGRVEVYHDNEWGTVCRNNFNSHAASVVCSMLGLPSFGAYATGAYGSGNGTIWLDVVRCNGDESSLRSCTQRNWGVNNCDHSEDVGVVCTEAENVRLVGGATHAEGRVEVYHDNEWGTVCRNNFNSHAASVVCSMLGLPSSGAYTTGVYGRGNGTIWLDDVKCNGNENSLSSCTQLDWGANNCGHHEDVGVVCTEDENVRLVGGATHAEGRVEVYHDNEWGTVCRDYFKSYAASVVCSMLGLPSSGAYATGAYGSGNGTIWLDDVNCNGNENSLRSCTRRGWGEHDCGHREDVGVVCTEAIGVDIRLVGSYTPTDGIVELRLKDTDAWHPVCFSDVFDDSTTLNIMCRMLGFDNLRDVSGYEELRQQGVEPFGFRNLNCFRETNLTQCYNSGRFLHNCTRADSGIMRIFCMPDCPVIRHCKPGGLTCSGRHSSVCNECEDEFQLTNDTLQCQPNQDLGPSSSSCWESPVCISGWACAALSSIGLVIMCVCLRIRVTKRCRNSNNCQQGEMGPPAVRPPEMAAVEERNMYEIPSRSGEQADVAYEILGNVYEEVK